MSNNIKKAACVFGVLVGLAVVIGFKIQKVSFDPITVIPNFSNKNLEITSALNSIAFSVGGAIHDSMEKICEVIGWVLVSVGAIDTSIFIYKLCSIEETPSVTENDSDSNIQ